MSSELESDTSLQARALYDNAGESPDELSFKRGDVLEVLHRRPAHLPGWWVCMVAGRVGVAPSNRLRILKVTSELVLSSCCSSPRGSVTGSVCSRDSLDFALPSSSSASQAPFNRRAGSMDQLLIVPPRPSSQGEDDSYDVPPTPREISGPAPKPFRGSECSRVSAASSSSSGTSSTDWQEGEVRGSRELLMSVPPAPSSSPAQRYASPRPQYDSPPPPRPADPFLGPGMVKCPSVDSVLDLYDRPPLRGRPSAPVGSAHTPSPPHHHRGARSYGGSRSETKVRSTDSGVDADDYDVPQNNQPLNPQLRRVLLQEDLKPKSREASPPPLPPPNLTSDRPRRSSDSDVPGGSRDTLLTSQAAKERLAAIEARLQSIQGAKRDGAESCREGLTELLGVCRECQIAAKAKKDNVFLSKYDKKAGPVRLGLQDLSKCLVDTTNNSSASLPKAVEKARSLGLALILLLRENTTRLLADTVSKNGSDVNRNSERSRVTGSLQNVSGNVQGKPPAPSVLPKPGARPSNYGMERRPLPAVPLPQSPHQTPPASPLGTGAPPIRFSSPGESPGDAAKRLLAQMERLRAGGSSGGRVSDPAHTRLQKRDSVVSGLGALSPSDLGLLRFYEPHVTDHLALLAGSVEQLYGVLRAGGASCGVSPTRAPPRLPPSSGEKAAQRVIIRTKMVVLAAHKLVYVADILHEALADVELKARLLNMAGYLCDTLKVTVMAGKTAALQFPARMALQELADRAAEVTHAADTLRRTVTAAAGLDTTPPLAQAFS